ncbi:hypothetical protein O7608_07500 [Solwaraspora sp. WMMA2056]|uniref:hypothetical protein n=1 Tax=Solwaraspora sp. WMMA2056 TaxID=3015161 RepID=UPI00259BF3A3|nr:hypothetical protein [Solwaraspora sp. WMMA2056]WJK42223.1 hypothetical protein O7608_07500 [Solwaraspora sp. WMMA2056]
MANIQEVKTGLSVSVEKADKVMSRIKNAIEEIDKMLAVLRYVSSSAGHPLVQAAITRCEQGKQRLVEAATLVRETRSAASEYRGLLG